MINTIQPVDDALKLKLDGLIVKDTDGTDYTVPVFFIDPEKEFSSEKYPYIAYYRAGIYPDNARWTNDLFYDDPTFDSSSGDLMAVKARKAPVPYAVYYGIRLYYQYNEDGVQMNTYMLTNLPRGAYLEMSGEKYDIEFISFKNPNSTYREFGVIKGNKPREFVDQYLYKVSIELDNAVRVGELVNRQGIQVSTKMK
jgi:hypothetical protein